MGKALTTRNRQSAELSFPNIGHVKCHGIHGEIDVAAQQIRNDGRTSAILRLAELYLATLLQKLAGGYGAASRFQDNIICRICFCIIDQTLQ